MVESWFRYLEWSLIWVLWVFFWSFRLNYDKEVQDFLCQKQNFYIF